MTPIGWGVDRKRARGQNDAIDSELSSLSKSLAECAYGFTAKLGK